jgi:integrative and conjugative element protein (TIGR02256 family)
MELQIGPYPIVIHKEPLNILEKFTQYSKKAPESGGVMMGKIINGQINVLKLSVPTALDKASRTNFERSKLGAQIILDYEFFNSNGQLTYLGEWHTHPEEFPTPSFTDLHMLKDQFKNNKLNTDFLMLLIKGTKGLYIRVIDHKNCSECKLK